MINHSVFEGEFGSVEDIENAFAEPKALEGCEVIYAIYDISFYDGEASVIFLKDGKLYEVHGAHCSCYGLEGQWEPEETTLEALEERARHGGGYPAAAAASASLRLWHYRALSEGTDSEEQA